jgi:hypothetical protein
MPTIEPLSVASLDYLRSFNLKCIALSKTGRVFTCDNPAGAVAAWWAKADDIDRIAAIAWPSGDVPGTAAKLGLVATPHAIVAKRTTERTARIEAALQQAKADGLLAQFHQEYKARRLKAKARGETFMGFAEAERRLRAVIADAVARGGEIPSSFIASVFDEARPSP